jgi:hypothetical protein
METIETKYFCYCKTCRILAASSKTGDPTKTKEDIKFMKTNTIQIIATTVAAGLVAGVGSTKVTGDYVTGVAITVGYFMVAALVALVVVDYRRNQRTYTV